MMKQTLLMTVLIAGIFSFPLYSHDQDMQEVESSLQDDMQDFMFDEPAPTLEEEVFPADVKITPTKRSFSIKEVPFYLSIFFSSLWNQRIKPAYYALVGYLVGSKK